MVPNKYCTEAVHIVVYLLHRGPTKVVSNITPEEAWFNKEMQVSHFRIFELILYVLVLDEKRCKLDPKCKQLVYVGYSDQSKAYRLLDISANKVTINKNVIVR